MTILLGLCGVMLVLYSAICVGLRQWQTRLLFFPDQYLKARPDVQGLKYRDIWLPVGKYPHDGIVHGWWIPSGGDVKETSTPVVLYLHGNGSNVGDLIGRGQRFNALGWNCLMIDYRGYGLSQGSFPAEDRVYEDAEAAWLYLVEEMGLQPEQIVVYGHSLGGAIAIELATRHPQMAGLIVEGSFTSMLDMARIQGRYHLIPVDWILTQRFESLAKVRSLIPPLLLLHGTADETIPHTMSQALYDAAQMHEPSPSTALVLIPDADHNDLPTIGGEAYLTALTTFLSSIMDWDGVPVSAGARSFPH